MVVAVAGNLLWRTAVKLVVSFLTTSKGTTLLLEVVHAHCRESRGTVVLSGVVVNLMNWYRCVDNMWLNGLLLNDGLDGLVDMVVHMLASDGWLRGAGTLTLNVGLLVAELCLLGLKLALHLVGVVVLVRTMLSWQSLVVMLLRENLRVLYRLHGCVVVILVDLLVNSSGLSLVLLTLHCLLLDSGGDFLVNGGVVVPGRRHELLDG